MSGLRNTIKGGWHPEGKEGGKESWRGDFKGINQVAGWMGKGNESNSDRSNHVSQPLSALKDPSAFGPPPKHTKYHGAAAAPNQANIQDPHRQEVAEAEEEQFQKPAPPPVPYRVNTSGLSTDNLPPPPVRRLDSASSASTSSISKSKPPKPPPRLPARNGSPVSDPPPAYSPAPVLSHDYINQDATSRLANAGVSVPGFGIGQEKSSSPAHTPVNKLQSRFSQMGTSDSPSKLSGYASRFTGSSPAAPSPPARPASNTSTSMNLEPAEPARGTSSVQDFRERHADKIDMGKEKWGGVTSRFNTFVEDRKFSAEANKRVPRPPSRPVSMTQSNSAAGSPTEPDIQAQAQRKKAPPPPPPKRTEFRASPVDASSPSPLGPPPVPHNTKPR
ncbi:Pc06g00620 [Penicillium rubens Wisconsin 54-1255]|uniref:Pc06g00620 protein n=1 Tax=Penicillium rubens (strain ATCC 28089 / DSM 1075 / NRRL 1951 / Wisconsin 54-1255) TaxID=500485 RepID=B6GW06_PENRW|nr:Pc06g00620 [Penicillium rubens Wisconsin 54-1255]